MLWPGRRIAVDLEHGIHFSVVTDPDDELFGHVSFAKVGVGFFWATGATVTTNRDATIDVTYVGSGSLDADASIELFAGVHQFSGSVVKKELDLAVRLDPQNGSGSGRLIVDGVTHVLSSVPSDPPPVDAALVEILDLFRTSDWAGLYEMLVSQFRDAVSAEELENVMAEGMAQYGTIVAVRTAGPVTEQTSGPWHTVEVALEFDFKLAGKRTTRPSRLELLFEGGRWSIFTVDPLGDPIR